MVVDFIASESKLEVVIEHSDGKVKIEQNHQVCILVRQAESFILEKKDEALKLKPKTAKQTTV
jgi:hypothetical protein